MNPKFLFAILLLLLNVVCADAQTKDDGDYFSETVIRYDDRVYQPTIATVLLSPDPPTMLPPVIALDNEEKLFLSFDDLSGEHKTLSYTVVHCNAKWEPSNCSITDFLDGFMDQGISNYSFSRNTIQRYIHYEASFPNESFKLLISGNYLLKVFQDGNQDKLVLTKRFMVYENKVALTGDVHAPTIVADRAYKQEIDFTVSYTDPQIANPFQEIYPVILQNGRWDNAITGLQPQFLMDKELRYDYEDVNVFKGGKEFRWFDTRTLKLNTERVEKITRDSATSSYHVQLLPDERRTFKRYMNNADINGKYLVRTQDNHDSEIEAEYCYVHFFLAWPVQELGGNMYVMGAMTDWQCTARNKMTYNKERRGYECVLYLKQGYFNYQYAFLKDGETAADEYTAEGMNQETENDYWILIYFRKTGARTDELVAVKRLNSRID
jgi:hypothetical protein